MSEKAKVRHYADERIDVSYDATRCIHAGVCVRRLPAVFDTARRPWILPSGADADTIAAVVARCPTGALHATRLDGGSAEAIPAENVIVPTPDGPLYVRGQLHLQSSEVDVTIDDVRLALCRCGQSRNKPFCDNSHRDAGFSDPGAIAGATSGGGTSGGGTSGGGTSGSGTSGGATSGSDTSGDGAAAGSVSTAAADARSGDSVTGANTVNTGADTTTNAGIADARSVLSIVASTNGPLAIEGAFTIRASDGGARHYAVKATLCRCGASGRKPFCDGSHRRIGFRSAPDGEVSESV